MAAVPVIINGVLMPKGKSAHDKPVPAVFLGWANVAGLEVGGGPIIPDPDAPHPEHPIALPDPPTPIDPPVDPPSEPSPGLAVVIKPAPSTGGWGLAVNDQKMQWFFVPGESGAGPKR